MGTDPDASVDPRVARTHRDVVRTAADLLMSGGWDTVTHAEVARRAGYSKATLYAHWPTRLDLIRDAVTQICDEARHPEPGGDLRTDLVTGLTDFAQDLTGRLARVLGGVIERSGTDPVVEELRRLLYDTGTRMLRTVLETHLDARDVDPVLALLAGGIFVRIAFEGLVATPELIEDLVVRALASVQLPAGSDGQAS
ncbi:transcriptional regulator [Cryptosporangium arvum DSM 44712]|uniref:Transcriptional regulator n=2 Tax=Cryptosporangium TaxID=65502 RepID=A0A010ZYX8_9ACTN|nr:transcriptional regulator [Cryptosporangium arvum DSM 44712]